MNIKHKKRWIVCIAILVIGGFIYGIYAIHGKAEVTSFSPEFEDAQNLSEIDAQEAVTEPGIEIPGYQSIKIAAETTDVKVDLTNPENNQVYFQISFYLPEIQETIYTSKLIKPGQHIYDITLERALEAGEYPLTIKYATYSADESLTPKNGADVNCTLYVE